MTADQWIWIGKVFQLMAAIILTPEIIGPDRFERLEESIEAQDFANRESFIKTLDSIIFLIGGLFVVTTARIIQFLAQKSLSSAQFNFLAVLLAMLAGIAGFLMIKQSKAIQQLIQSVLAWLTAYLRRISLLRTVAIATAIALFFLGVGLGLVLEWPF